MPTFADVTHVVATEAGTYAVDIDPAWTIGGKPNGGYLLALLGRAAVATSDHPDVVAASAHYLRAPVPGRADISVSVLRTGRASSQLRTQLTQAGELCVEALLITSELRPDPDAESAWTGGVPDPFPDGPTTDQDAVRLPSTNPNGLHLPIYDHVEVRLDRRSLGFGRGEPSGRGELYGWLSLPDGAQPDPLALLYVVDAFPPATLDVAMSGWVPTFALSAYVRAKPAPGPLRVLHRAGLIQGQRVDESCWVWDSRHQLVAHSTQLAGIRFT